MFQEDGMPSLVRGSGAFPGENRAPQKSAFLVNSETFATRFGVFDESSASFSIGQSTPAASQCRAGGIDICPTNRHLPYQMTESREEPILGSSSPGDSPFNTIKINDWLR